MKTLMAACMAVTLGMNAQTKTIKTAPATPVGPKTEQDKASIRSMCGIYKVSFDFAETFSQDTGYKYHPRYKEWGIEYVFITEETPTKIALQHLLIVNDTVIVKHWRQDWVYENTEVYKYYKDNEWIREKLAPEQWQGTWTQKVYQVDDSPRYESYGTWVHVDGKHYWEGVNDSPLPRREFTKRSDYNVMRRHSRIETFGDSWALIQDNEKVVRKDGIDKTICWEKGLEKFTKGSYDATPAIKWWDSQKQYWADVRKVWGEVYAGNAGLKLAPKVNDKRLFDSLFELGDKVCSQKSYVRGSGADDIRKVIQSYIKGV